MQKIIKALFWHTINRDDLKTTKKLSKDLKIFLLLCVRSESAAHCLFLRLGWTFNSASFFDTQKATRRSEPKDWSPQSILAKTGTETMGDGALFGRSLQEVNRISETFFFETCYKILNGIRWFPMDPSRFSSILTCLGRRLLRNSFDKRRFHNLLSRNIASEWKICRLWEAIEGKAWDNSRAGYKVFV